MTIENNKLETPSLEVVDIDAIITRVQNGGIQPSTQELTRLSEYVDSLSDRGLQSFLLKVETLKLELNNRKSEEDIRLLRLKTELMEDRLKGYQHCDGLALSIRESIIDGLKRDRSYSSGQMTGELHQLLA